MKYLLRTLRPLAAACLLAAAGSTFATAPTTAHDTVATLQAAYARAVPEGERAALYRDLFADVLLRVQRSYAREVDWESLSAAALKVLEPLPAGAGEPAQVFGRAINAALGTLDPYSRYLDPRSHGSMRGDASGSFGGLGLEVEPGEDGVRIVAPMPGSPGERAGLRAGDRIVQVDEQPLRGVPLADAIARMRGQPGTQVSLVVRRVGLAEDFSVPLVRETIRRQLLRWSMEGEVLVLRLSSFTGAATSALKQAIEQATASAAPRAVVLDLRGNPGGLLREAVTTADAFLGQGEIVSLRGRTASVQRAWKADAGQLLPGVPMVVLIDRRSASASELVAAALQENGRATVMGQRSLGKGTVQSTFPLGEEIKGALKLTTSFYHGPSGRSVQRTGVAPDVELLLATVPPGLREGDPLAAGPEPLRVEPERCTTVVKAADPALSCAVAYLLAGDRVAFEARLAADRSQSMR
jgi:carboxyl-terminal processing protease